MPTGDRKQQGKTRRRPSDPSPEPAPGESELRPFAHPVSDALVLAATERAEHHKPLPKGLSGVLLGDVFAHMGFIYNGGATRQLRPRLDALLATGALETTRRNSIKLWGLTSTGRQQLAQARRNGEGQLPESPQHRAWRHTRALAAERIERYREQLRTLLDETDALLHDGMRVHSDSWLILASELSGPSSLIGAAIYCLKEWAEPDDAHADVDDCSDPDDGCLDPDERARRRYMRIGRRHAIVRSDAV